MIIIGPRIELMSFFQMSIKKFHLSFLKSKEKEKEKEREREREERGKREREREEEQERRRELANSPPRRQSKS